MTADLRVERRECSPEPRRFVWTERERAERVGRMWRLREWEAAQIAAAIAAWAAEDEAVA
jgi:hypothetical protein